MRPPHVTPSCHELFPFISSQGLWFLQPRVAQEIGVAYGKDAVSSQAQILDFMHLDIYFGKNDSIFSTDINKLAHREQL